VLLSTQGRVLDCEPLITPTDPGLALASRGFFFVVLAQVNARRPPNSGPSYSCKDAINDVQVRSLKHRGPSYYKVHRVAFRDLANCTRHPESHVFP